MFPQGDRRTEGRDRGVRPRGRAPPEGMDAGGARGTGRSWAGSWGCVRAGGMGWSWAGSWVDRWGWVRAGRMGWAWLDRPGLEKGRQGWAAQRLEVQRTEVLRGENHTENTQHLQQENH